MNSLPVAKEYVIDIVGLHKSFQRQATLKGGYSTIKSLFLGLGKGKKATGQKVQSMAISDLTLRIRKGASVGIIGRNGSGKSTLLKLIKIGRAHV